LTKTHDSGEGEGWRDKIVTTTSKRKIKVLGELGGETQEVKRLGGVYNWIGG